MERLRGAVLCQSSLHLGPGDIGILYLAVLNRRDEIRYGEICGVGPLPVFTAM